MANSLDALILEHDDLIRASLVTTFDPIDDDPLNNSQPRYQKSEYTSPDEITAYMKQQRKSFSLLSLNVDSIKQKEVQLKIFIGELLKENVSFSCICIQEARIDDDSDLTSYELDNYTIFHQGRRVTSKGGLITWVRQDFKGSYRENMYKSSTRFEALFVEIRGPTLKENKITIGNFYRPGRNNASTDVKSFCSELRPILNKLRGENSFSIICGDFNINLLKLESNSGFSSFFDLMCGKDFQPLITLPTRFAEKTCSLLDHIWVCKPSKAAYEPAKSTSRVFLKKIAKADHLPCAITLDIMDELKTPAPKFIYTQKIDEENIAAFREDLISLDLLNLVQQSPNSDPEATSNLISDAL